MKTSLRASLAVLLAAVLAERPAVGCCEDVLTCAAAVSSGGLTCAIEVALDGLKLLLEGILRERDEAAAAFEAGVAASLQETKSVLDAWIQTAHAAGNDAASSAQKATNLVGDDHTRLQQLARLPAATSAVPGAGTKIGPSAAGRVSAPTPAPAGRLGTSISLAEAGRLLADDSPAQLKKDIDHERDLAQGKVTAAVEAAGTAKAAADRAAAWSRDAFAADVLVAMAGLIAAVKNGISNPVGAIGALAAAVSTLGAIEKTLNDLETALEQDASKREDLADVPRPDVDAAREHAQRARDLLAKLEKLLRLQTLVERQAEFRAPLAGSATTASARKHLLSSRRASDVVRSLQARVGTLEADAHKFARLRPPDVSPFRAKLAAGLDAQFRGKTAAAAAATRDALLAEARRRYAADPKTLAGVEKIVSDAAARR